MRLSRFHFVVLALVVVVGSAVAVAVFFIERVFEAREEFVDKVREGRSEELIEKPPAAPAPEPLDRSTSRSVEALVVTAPEPARDSAAASRPARRRLVVIRANGEFVRLPAGSGEPGPLVTGLLDRAELDDLLRRALALDAAPPGGAALAAEIELQPGKRVARSLSADSPEAAALRTITGRNLQATAAPARLLVATAPAEPGPASPWPLERVQPKSLIGGGLVLAESDRVRFRQAVLDLLAKDARFTYNDEVWKVTEVDLIPP